jgi:hypothetical protein
MICKTQSRAQFYCSFTFLIYSWLTNVNISLHLRILLPTLGNYLKVTKNASMNKNHLRRLLPALSYKHMHLIQYPSPASYA